MQGMKITDQVTGPENDGPSKSQGVKMQDLKMQDLKMLDTKIVGMKHVIAHLLWSYRVLICNAVIWCSMLCWFCTLGRNVFLLYSLRLPGYNENYRYRDR